MATQNYFKAKNGLEIPSADTVATTSNSFPTIRPTLNLDFANSKTVDERIAFSRASSASYTDANGVIQYIAQDQPRIDHDGLTRECKGLLIEEQRTNLITSQTFSNWSNSAGRFNNTFAVAPDGTLTAYKLCANKSNQRQYIWRAETPVSNTNLTFSVYIKAAEYTTITLGFRTDDATNGTGDYYGSTVDITSGTPVGNNWYRHSFTKYVGANAALCLSQIVIGGTSGFTGDGVSGIYVWGAQLEAAPFATSYIPTSVSFSSRASGGTYVDSTGAVRYAGGNQARYNYAYDSSSGRWISQGLLIEAACTNLYTNSVYGYSNGVGATITTPTQTSFDDRQTPVVLSTPNAGNATHYLNTASVGTLTANTVYTFSFYAKPNGYTQLLVHNYADKNGTATFNLSTATVTQTSGPMMTASITPAKNGWYRCAMTFTCPADYNNTFYISPTNNNSYGFNADGTSGMYFTGWQFEVSATATAYIPTYGASATRAVDVSTAVATTRAADSAYMLNANTYGDFKTGISFNYKSTLLTASNTSNGYVAQIAGGYNGFVLLRSTGSGGPNPGIAIRDTSGYNASVYTASGSASQNTAVAFDSSEVSVYSAGTYVGNDTTVYYEGPWNTIYIGGTSLTAERINGHISKFTIYPKKLSNAELQALSK